MCREEVRGAAGARVSGTFCHHLPTPHTGILSLTRRKSGEIVHPSPQSILSLHPDQSLWPLYSLRWLIQLSRCHQGMGNPEPLAERACSAQNPGPGASWAGRREGSLGRWSVQARAYFIVMIVMGRVSQGREAFLSQPGRAPPFHPTPQYFQYSYSHDLTATARPGQAGGQEPGTRQNPHPPETIASQAGAGCVARIASTHPNQRPRRQPVLPSVYSSQADSPPSQQG